MAYRIDRATVVHLPWLRLLFTRWVAEQPMSYPLMDDEEFDHFTLAIARHLSSNPDFVCFVAIIGRRVVGFLAGEIEHRAIGKPHRLGKAHWLYVVPKHRAKGVARQLIAAGLAWLAERDVDTVELTELDAATAGAWARRGFVPYLTSYHLPTATIAAQLAPPANGHDRKGISHGQLVE